MEGVVIILLLFVLGSIIVMYEVTNKVSNKRKNVTKQERKN